MEDLVNLLVPVMISVTLFSFLAIAIWSNARRREREAYYKSETLKKIAETQGTGAVSAIEFLREQEKLSTRRRLEGLKLGGLISCAVGLGMIALLTSVPSTNGPQPKLVGLVPFLVGVVLLLYAYILAPKE